MLKYKKSLGAIILLIALAGGVVITTPKHDEVSNATTKEIVKVNKNSTDIVDENIPEVAEQSTPVSEPIVSSQEPVIEQPPEKDPVELLLSQYGWSSSPERDAINNIMSRFPHKFTSDNRDASFAYLNNVAQASGGITFISNYLSSIQGISTEDHAGSQMVWDRLAKRVGL